MKIYSLNIGVTYTDEKHYYNLLTNLPSCAIDAKYMHDFAGIFDYDESLILLNNKATTENVNNAIIYYSEKARSGDLVIIFYSGHGSTMRDMNADEKNGYDQTWCLYDRMMIDDEFRRLWKNFKSGVNILVIMDSCHSGTAFKNVGDPIIDEFHLDYTRMVKSMKTNNAELIFQRNKGCYKSIVMTPYVKEEEISCSVMGLSACQDDEEALAGPYISLFTRLLITGLADNSKDLNNYKDLVAIITEQSKSIEQITPNFEPIGVSTSFFDQNKPFLKTNKDYPENISDLYSDLIFGSNPSLDENLKDSGLIVEVNEKSIEKFEELTKNERIVTISKNENTFQINDKKLTKAIKHPWDKAYELYDELKTNGISSYIEPDLNLNTEEQVKSSRSNSEDSKYLNSWPNPPVGSLNEFVWHLGDNYSQLGTARDYLMSTMDSSDLKVKIAQIDTGYSPEHPAIPDHIPEGVSFVKGESGKPAHDSPTSAWIEQEDHGTATLSLLASETVPEEVAYGKGSRKLGAIPFATIYPIRISDAVALTALLGNTMPFVKAIEKAIEEKCEVITMSMGGLPIRAWAKVINKAYEAGITIVSAAGNSWVKGFAKIAPKKVLYPARFDRVIAAAGVCYNQYPYVAKANPYFGKSKTAGGEVMQGNYNPKSAMRTAIAAYTPNIPWATFDKNKKPIILRNGGGTSSATPQIAAAAALWIAKNKQELIDKKYYGTWKQVEAVRYALFESAKKRNIVGWKKYYGNGILQAKDALDIPVPDFRKLKKAKKAKISIGFLKYIQVLIFRKSGDSNIAEFDEVKSQMIFQEITQVMERDPKLIELYNEIDLVDMVENKEMSDEQFREICVQVAQSPYSSGFLKQTLQIKYHE